MPHGLPGTRLPFKEPGAMECNPRTWNGAPATGVGPAFRDPEARMAEYTGSIEIEHPAAEVFAFLADPRHLPHYLPTVRGMECEGGPEGVLRLTVSGEA